MSGDGDIDPDAPWPGIAKRRVLVTGAGGFIGGRLVRRLVASGATVHGTCRGAPPAASTDVRWWPVDLANDEATLCVVQSADPEVIVHLAGRPVGARTPGEVVPAFRSNLASTVSVLSAAAAAGRPRVLLTGSLEEPPGDAMSDVASSPYAISKWAARGYGQMFHELFDVPVVTLRVFMVYGPTQSDTRKLVPYTILSFLRGEAPRLSSGRREVDWVYVDDVVEAYLTAAFKPDLAGSSADVGSGRLVSIRDLVLGIARVLGTPIAPQFGALPDRPNEQVRVADLDRTEAVLGWAPRFDLDEGLRRTAAWYARELEAGRA